MPYTRKLPNEKQSKGVQVVLQTDIHSMRYAAPNTQVLN